MAKRKAYPLRIDPAVYEALRLWADDELRSVNAQIEFLLARALREAGRAPRRSRGGGSPRSGPGPSPGPPAGDTDPEDAP